MKNAFNELQYNIILKVGTLYFLIDFIEILQNPMLLLLHVCDITNRTLQTRCELASD